MQIRPASWCVLLLVGGCAPKGPVELWTAEGDTVLGEVRVVPLIHAYDPPQLRTDSFVTNTINASRHRLRQQRMEQVFQVPEMIGATIPGAVHARLNDAWNGYFTPAKMPLSLQNRLADAIRNDKRDQTERLLRKTSATVGGQAVLVTWVRTLRADPLTAEAFPGDRIETPHGPVFVDFREEPYRITAEVGAALIRNDGTIVIHYAETTSAALTSEIPHWSAAADLSGVIAADLATLWPDDPRLWSTPSVDSLAIDIDYIAGDGEEEAPVDTTESTWIPEIPFRERRLLPADK